MEPVFTKYDIFFPYTRLEFRNVDILSSFESVDAQVHICTIQPFRKLVLQIESSSDLPKICQAMNRSVTSRNLTQIWCESDSFESLVLKFKEELETNSKKYDRYLNSANPPSIRVDVDSYGKRIHFPEKMEYVNRLVPFFNRCRVDLKNPDVIIFLYFEYDDVEKHAKNPEGNILQRVYLTVELCKSGRSNLLKTYDLKKRRYLGTTSMPAFHSFMLANCAKASEKSVILDPFAGTGSLMISCRHFGSFVLGMDLDLRVLRGTSVKKKKNVYTNFTDYFKSTSRMDFFRTDFCLFSHHGIRTKPSGIFDAIVCDPPYGFRESCSRIGRKEYRFVEKEFQDGHIPSRVQYEQSDMMCDLLNFSSQALVLGGRLVFWLIELPALPTVLPTHPCFDLKYQVLEKVSRKVNRRLVVLEKMKVFEKWLPNEELGDITSKLPSSEELRKEYYSAPKWKQEFIKM